MPNYLEYRNSNLLIRYPFIDNLLDNTTLPIQNTWFSDIVFYLFDTMVRSIYVSNMTVNTTSNNLILTFANSDTASTLIVATIPLSDVVDMTNPTNPSYVGFSNSTCAVKIVLGTGLADLFNIFRSVNYSVQESSLSNGAIILGVPRVTTLSFLENYPFSIVETYDTDNPNVTWKFGANTTGSLSDVETLAIDVQAGSGTGLFNPCIPVFPTENVLSINLILPDLNGNIFLTPDSCYSISVLNENDITTLGSQIASYDPFSIPFQSPDTFDALIPGKSFLITNNCSPKCPPESLNAFAYYLNRVRNGVQELFEYVESPGGAQTTGVCNTSASSNVLTATSFTSTYPDQSGFIKYYHEGKTVVIRYNNVTSELKVITEVVNANTVVLDSNFNMTSTGSTFAVNDLGLFQQLNNAIVDYNTRAMSLNVPNGRVDFTTTEGNDQFGEFGTFVSIVVTVFNPTINTITFNVGTTLSGDIAVVAGSEKIRNGEQIFFNTSTGALTCKTFATWENLYFIPCGNNEGSVTIDSTWTFNAVTTELLGGSKVVDITSSECAPVVTSPSIITAAAGTSFCYQVVATNDANQVDFGTTTLPSWAVIDNTIPTTCNISGTITDTVDTSYQIGMTVSNPDGGYIPFTLYLSVVAVPILSAVDQTTQYEFPFLYQIPATGMPTSYGATGLPPGLSIDPTNGVISGTSSLTGVYPVTLSATNIAGTGHQTIDITVFEPTPTITSPSTLAGSQGNSIYYQIEASPFPISYTCGTLPAGLLFNVTYGFIYGFPTGFGTSTVALTATNAAGTSPTFTLTFNIVQSAPVITSPLNVSGVHGQPFTYTITARNTPTSFGATSLPSGLTLSGAVISGVGPAAGVYSGGTISATNSVGTDTQNIKFTFV